MSVSDMIIRPYSNADEKAVIDLWQRCNLIKPQNNPKLDIERKLRVNPELFLVGLIDGKVVATAMGGYEGHRGWINYLGVDPAYQKRGLGKQIMEKRYRGGKHQFILINILPKARGPRFTST